MKDINGKIQYKEKEYSLVFNLNVMESIQEEYGTIEKWGNLTDGKGGEVDAKAVIFGFTQMINEGIDIENEEKGTNTPPMTLKQVGRMLSDVGLQMATENMNDLIVKSTQTQEKNV